MIIVGAKSSSTTPVWWTQVSGYDRFEKNRISIADAKSSSTIPLDGLRYLDIIDLRNMESPLTIGFLMMRLTTVFLKYKLLFNLWKVNLEQ